MRRAKPLSDSDSDAVSGHVVMCPACSQWHLFDKRWTFDGNLESPTFSPSMLVNGTLHEKYPHAIRCHSYVRAGKIEFLSDCSHTMAGMTVPLPDIDA